MDRVARLGVWLGRAVAALGLLTAVGAAQIVPPPGSPQQLKQLSLEDLMGVKVVTATQVATDPFDLPYLVGTRSLAEYERTLPRSFPMWLDGIPGVMIQKTANGQMSPYIRGFTGFRTLLLVDGIRLNNSFFREGPNQYASTIDPLSASRIEVVKGPASVLYGSDSIGGTINAIPARLLDVALPGWERKVFARAATAEDSQLVHGEVSGPVGAHAALRLAGTRKWLGDLRGGRDVGVQRGTGYDESGYDGRLEYQLRPGLRLELTHQHFDQFDVNRTHSTPNGTTWLGLLPGTDRQRTYSQQRTLTYTRLNAETPGAIFDHLEFTLSRHAQNEQMLRVRSDGRRDTSLAGVDTYGATCQAQRDSRFGRWVGGATYYCDVVNTSANHYLASGAFDRADIQGAVADDSRYDLAGAFVQNQLPAWGPWHLTLRSRYDKASAHARRILDPVTNLPTSFVGRWASVVSSARVTFAPAPTAPQRWLGFAGVSEGFRAPNLSDLSRLDTTGSGQIETPSTNVKPEDYRIYEVGLKFRSSQVEFSTAVFHTMIDDMSIREPTGRIVRGLAEVTKRNSGHGFVHGAEFEGRLSLPADLLLRAAFTTMRGEVDVYPTNDVRLKIREPLSRLMPTTTRLALEWTPPRRQLSLKAGCTLAERQNRLSAADRLDRERIPPGGTPGYTVWDLRATWQPRPKLTLSAVLENLTDRDYRIHGSGLNEPGRNLVLGGSFQF